jgi:hypothetical protein
LRLLIKIKGFTQPLGIYQRINYWVNSFYRFLLRFVLG